jgi:hypothetical protein
MESRAEARLLSGGWPGRARRYAVLTETGPGVPGLRPFATSHARPMGPVRTDALSGTRRGRV